MHTFISRLKTLFLLVLLLNGVIILILAVLGYLGMRDQRRQLLELGGTLLRAFENSRPLFMQQSGFNSPVVREFVKMTATQSTVTHLVIYDKNGKVIFTMDNDTHELIDTKAVFPSEKERDAELVLYREIKPFVTSEMGRVVGRHMGFVETVPPQHESPAAPAIKPQKTAPVRKKTQTMQDNTTNAEPWKAFRRNWQGGTHGENWRPPGMGENSTMPEGYGSTWGPGIGPRQNGMGYGRGRGMGMNTGWRIVDNVSEPQPLQQPMTESAEPEQKSETPKTTPAPKRRQAAAVPKTEYSYDVMIPVVQPTRETYYAALAIDSSALDATRLRTFTAIAIGVLVEGMIFVMFLLMRRITQLYTASQEKLAYAEKAAATGRLASVLAHEIKNPLSSMGGLISFARKKESDPQVEDILARAQDEVERLSGIVNDFLSYGREIELHREDVPVRDLIARACDLLSHDAAEKSVSVVFSPDCFTANMDKNRMLQVFVNLMLNAIQASPAGSEVQVNCNFTEKTVSISNRVEGELSIETEKLFEPFYTTKTKGSGLGLAITRRIVEQHGFTITVSASNPFTVTIAMQAGA